MKIAVIGQGYVGLPVAIAAVNANHDVVGIDIDISKVSGLNKGFSPIDDITHDQINQARETSRYLATSDFKQLQDSEIIVVCVPTPLKESSKPDFSYIESAAFQVGKYMKADSLVIIESTVSPGTTRGLVSKILQGSEKSFYLAYSPERIDPANKKWNITNTPKLVAGLTEEATKRAVKFYSSFVSEVIVGSSLEVIETAKLLENSFRLINISFINEFAEFCWKMQIDVREVINAAATKPYGFMPFYPGAGVGGHCIPVDPSYLVAKAREIGASTKFIDLSNNINHSLPNYFTGVATGMLGILKGKKIIIIGVAYKPNVTDIRETPASGLIQALEEKGAEVLWHDDLVKEWLGKKSVDLSFGYDLAILVNPQVGIDLSALGSIPILDTRGGYL